METNKHTWILAWFESSTAVVFTKGPRVDTALCLFTSCSFGILPCFQKAFKWMVSDWLACVEAMLLDWLRVYTMVSYWRATAFQLQKPATNIFCIKAIDCVLPLQLQSTFRILLFLGTEPHEVFVNMVHVFTIGCVLVLGGWLVMVVVI